MNDYTSRYLGTLKRVYLKLARVRKVLSYQFSFKFKNISFLFPDFLFTTFYCQGDALIECFLN